MKTIQVGGDIDVDDVAFFHDGVIGNAVTDHFIERRTAGFWVSPITEG